MLSFLFGVPNVAALFRAIIGDARHGDGFFESPWAGRAIFRDCRVDGSGVSGWREKSSVEHAVFREMT